MDIATELTPLLLVATFGFLGWGLFRAWKRGKAAVLVWLQGLMLFFPWIIFLGLMVSGVYLNLAGFIVILVIFTGLYILLGRQARKAMTQELQSMEQYSDLGSPGEESGATSAFRAPKSAVPAVEPMFGISTQDLEAIKTIFSVDSFFATETIPYGEGAIFRGNLRLDPELALERLTQRLQDIVGERYWLYLVEDPQERPAVVVLPDEIVNQRTTQGATWLAGGLLLATLVSTLVVGGNLFGIDLLNNWGAWPMAAPFAAGILSILVVHEAGHRWMAGQYGIRLSPAFTIPSLGIGTLGTLNRIESPVPSRKALFDVAVAGPIVGGVVALGVLITGLILSSSQGELYLPTSIFRNSVLVGTLARWLMGEEFQLDIVSVHSLVAVGWIGLGVTALSVLPAGQLDGGRIVQAIYGRKTAGRATLITLVVLGIAALSNVLALYWALLILFMAREPERPPLNELSDTDPVRDVLGLVVLLVMVLTLLPIAPPLARILGFPS